MFTEEQKEDMALDVENIEISLIEYVEQMKLFLGMEEETGVETLTILAGQDKTGNPEGFGRLDIHKSEIISIVRTNRFRKIKIIS